MENYKKLFDTICRVCLRYGNSENMVNLTEQASADGLSCYGKAVSIFANIHLPNKTLPSRMCENCLFILKQAIVFKKTCENSDVKLAKFMKKFDSSQSDFKQKICEYVMFTDCFPHENFEKCSTKPSTKIIANIIKEKEAFALKNELNRFLDQDNDFEDPYPLSEYQENTETTFKSDNQDCDYDQMLDEMEKIIEMTPEKLNGFRKKYDKKTNCKYLRKSSTNCKTRKLLKRNVDLQCKICHKVLTNLNSFNGHMARHTGGQFICEHCGKKYVSKGELHYHLASSHNIGEMYICKECGFKAPKRYELMEHERIHTGERPYTCDKCGLTFRRKYIWKKHAICHMEKNVQCPQCPRKFSQRRDVLAHMNNVHDRMYVFACSQCDVTYAKSSSVRRHLVEKHSIARELQGKIKRINLGKCSLSIVGV